MTEQRSRPSILVVDDEPGILQSVASLLEDDFVVTTLTNAEPALKLLDDFEISVIIADQRMPGLTGDAFLAKARERSQATRILITGYADIDSLVRAVNDGQIYTYIAKPWEPHHFKMSVVKAAEHCHLAKEAVRERNLLHALMNNIPDAIWFEDTTGCFLDVNKAAAAFLGVGDASLAIGRKFCHFLNAEEASQIQAEEERVIRLRRAETNKISQIHWRDAGARWMSITSAPILERGGDVVGLVGVSRDITDQKQAELALQHSEERYRQIVETAAEGVWIFDEQFRTLFVNHKMAAMLECATEEMTARPVTEFLADEDTNQALEELDRCNASRSTVDLRLKKKDGTEIWAMVSSCPLLDSSSRRSGTLAMFTDVTERKGLEEQFRQAQKLEAIGRLAGGIAHDFNNILSIITGHSQLLLRRLGTENLLYDPVEKIAAAVDQAANLTRQLLSFSRRRVVKAEIVDLNTVVTNFGRMCRPIIREQVLLITKLDPLETRVRADAGQLDQVLMNLVVNARDAMPQGGKLTIETKNLDLRPGALSLNGDKRPGSYVLLAVSDTGVGMDAETQMHVFEPFFTTKEEGKGTGLGLSTVYGIIRQHGGWVELKSELGQGTCFSIYLPRVTDEATASPSVEAPARWPQGHETILVVEDRVSLREVIRDTLQTCGYHVLEAGNGQDGLEVCECHPKIDLVLTDLVMPGLSGREFAERLKTRRPQIKVLYMSGSDAHAPVDGPLIQKPFKPAFLASKIREVLSTSGTSSSILIADDDGELRALLRSILEEAGYRVFTAENGKKASAILRDQTINLMLTDLVMPEQEGMETIVKARKDFPDLQIVAVSGAFAGTILDAASHVGASAILEKPLQIDEVLELVQRLLGEPTKPPPCE